VPVSTKLLGRVINGQGEAIDGKGSIAAMKHYPAIQKAPDALSRTLIKDQLGTGVRAIDALLPFGKGQRLGIFAGSGVGKSTLLGMIARNTTADVNVIALIGERGREVREFIEHDLGPEGLKRSVIIVATSDQPPVARLKAAYVATAVAEYFRDLGKDVVLMFDSVTRFAKAQREIGLATGEAPATRGYPPSVFSLLPRLLERAGTGEKGSITGLYTVLVDGDDLDEPISDAVRGILDGHLVLSRRLAERNQYPAIDVLSSISRLASKVCTMEMKAVTSGIRTLMAVHAENEDLINVGAYAMGTNAEIDAAIKKQPAIRAFLQQGVAESSDLVNTWKTASIISGASLPADQVQKLEEATATLAARRQALYSAHPPARHAADRSTPRLSVPRHLEDEFSDPDAAVLRFDDEDELRDAEARDIAAHAALAMPAAVAGGRE
jgi:flagellum-specific ATP synthase